MMELINPLSIFDFALFTNLSVFLLMMIIIMLVIGLFSGRMAIGTMSGWMAFVYVAQGIEIPVFRNTLYILLVLITVAMATNLYAYAVGDGI